MIQSTLILLLPLFFVMGVGYVAGRTKRINHLQMLGINRVLVEFTLPAALFTGTVQTPRAELVQHGPLILALLIAFVVFWVIGNVAGRLLFHHTAGESVLQATAIAFPNTGFMGVSILGGLFGTSSLASVAISTALGVLFFVPSAVIILEITRKAREEKSSAVAHSKLQKIILPAFVNAGRAPLVWAPILAALLVLFGLALPPEILAMLNLLGSITGGLAMFAAGLVLAAFPLRLNFEIGFNTFLKMIAQPLFMLVVMSALGVVGLRAHEGVILAALPTPILATILATQYGTYQSEASSTLVLTSLVLVILLPLWRIVLG